jgi:ABC-2 type transport system ATP-binding protein
MNKMNIIEVKNLNYSYAKHVVLDNLTFAIPQGAIFGFLGQNGSGKTTTIKLLLGLLPCKINHIFYHDLDMVMYREKILAKTGAMVGTPTLYNHLTGREHLQYVNCYYKKNSSQIDKIMDLVGLSAVQNKIVKKYSTGMRQRLAIGLAIFHEPEMLILDEPLNGLDPKGIYDVRNILLQLNKKGTTIFLSSHIISEVEKICTHIGILEQKKIIYYNNFVDANLENIYLDFILKHNIQ